MADLRDVWVTVPTRGDHPDLLADLIDTLAVPRHHVVVVTTKPDVPLPEGVVEVPDLGPVSVHRWWIDGIVFASRNGAKYVLVCNDDIRVAPDTLPKMVDQIHADQTPLCWATGNQAAITGWCWLLRVASPVRPDQALRWWWGDNDLDRQASLCGGASRVEAGVVHVHGNETTHASPELQALALQDNGVYHQKWSG